MTHARTLPRYVGAAGLAAGLLVAFPSLTHAQNYPPYYSQHERVHIAATYARQQSMASGTAVVPVDARARWTSPDGSITRYRTSTINVPKSTLRIGALSAMSRGIMHPGFQAAVLAAGFFIANNHVVQIDDTHSEALDGIPPGRYTFRSGTSSSTNWDSCSTQPGSLRSSWGDAYDAVPSPLKPLQYYTTLLCGTAPVRYHIVYSTTDSPQYPFVSYWIIQLRSATSESTPYFDPSDYGETYTELTPEQLEQIDPHIPPELYDALYNGGPIPEWQDAITALGSPASDVSADGALAPEVASAMGSWGQNMDAQYNGDPAPNPDHPTTGNTAQEQVAEETLDGHIPDFPSFEPEWQVETIDELPAFDIGIGSGQCPPPTVVSLPFPFNTTIELSWQPICDFASMIRGAVIAVSMILSLYIVLRRV